MATSSRRISRAPTVNLCCAQCEAQIGIFENEWIRLTSSYARSKEKGSHFATQVGEKTQVVPAGPAARAADGCEMAEVFCRRCSNTVGQYCKAAPDAEKANLVGQYFYKLSRTYLKDSDTREQVDPVFAFSPDAPFTYGSRSSTVPRSSMTPQRWQSTPLRQASSTPVSVQAATRNALRTQAQPRSSLNHFENPNDTQPIEENEDQDQEQASQTSMLRQQSNRISSQGAQLFDHAGRIRDMNARMVDQDNFLNEQAAQLQEQSTIIDEQNRMMNEQGNQLKKISRQLSALQRSMSELQSTMLETRSSDVTVPSDPATQQNLIVHFESMLQSMKLAQSESQQLQHLREENRFLSSRLQSMTAAMGGAVLEDSRDVSHDTVTPTAQSLGKRKRDDNDAGPSAMSAVLNLNVNLATSQDTEQVPTPQSSQDDEDVPYEQPMSHNPTSITEGAGSKQAAQNIPKKKRGRPRKSSLAALPADVETATTSTRRRSRRSTGMMQTAQADPEENIQVENASTNDPTQASRKDRSKARQQDENADDHSNSAGNTGDDEMGVFDLQDADASGSEFQLDELAAQADHDEDTLMKDKEPAENVEFSDEDEVMHGTAPQSLEVVFDRNGRSMAPEPARLKPKTRALATQPVTLDRMRMATPIVWSSAQNSGTPVPQMIRPPAIQTRRDALHKELREFGLEEWIPRNKNCKEYRDAVNAARARAREIKRAQILASKGLNPTSANPASPSVASPSSAALSTIQNVPAAPASQNSEITPGDENPHITDKTTNSQSSGHAEASTNAASSTRTRARRSSTTILGTTLENMEPEAGDKGETADIAGEATMTVDKNDTEEAPPAKRKRQSTGRTRGQRKSDTTTVRSRATRVVTPTTTEKVKKKPGRKPRKSAPAALEGANTNITTTDASVTNNLRAEETPVPVASASFTTAAAAASPSSVTSTISSRQKLLDKMKLRALQEEAKIIHSQSQPQSEASSRSASPPAPASHPAVLVNLPEHLQNNDRAAVTRDGKASDHRSSIVMNDVGDLDDDEDEEALILARDKMAEEAMELEMALLTGT